MHGTTGIWACLADALTTREGRRVAFSWLASGDFNFLSTRLALAGVQEIYVECLMVSQFLPSLLAILLSFFGVLWVQLLVCLFSNTLPKAQLQKNKQTNKQKNTPCQTKNQNKKNLESQIPMLVKTTCRLGDEVLHRSEIFPVGYINELGGCVASIFACSGLFQARFRGFHIFSGQVAERTTH